MEKEVRNIEKHSFKISIWVALTIIIFLVTMTYNFSNWKKDIESEQKSIISKVDHIWEKYTLVREDITQLQDKSSDKDIQLATINVKLTNIELLMIELKADIKQGFKN